MQAMILAAGRGERMRPLTDTTPKPLLVAGGKPLIAWQIEALARAGCRDLVINASHLADLLIESIGDGARYGVRIRWSREPEPLETAGGIATALPLLRDDDPTLLVVSADVWTHFDYASLRARAATIARDETAPRAHLVMVPNPAYHPHGDFVLDGERLREGGGARLTFGNVALYDTALFRELPRFTRLKLLPLWREWIARGIVSGELFLGPWANVGTAAQLAELDTQLPTPARHA
jgi:MurNAc alpha-1-phosphate uridylyltransferase